MGHQPEPENRHPIRAIKIPKHDRRASCIGDGLTVLDSQVPFLLGFKIGQMHFFVKVDFDALH
jgi:hypothetical protein